MQNIMTGLQMNGMTKQLEKYDRKDQVKAEIDYSRCFT